MSGTQRGILVASAALLGWASAAAQVTVGTMSPASGSGGTQVFTFTASSSSSISTYAGLFNWTADGSGACYFVYSGGLLYLRDDLSATWLGGYAPTTSHSISNSQCTLNVGSSAVSGTTSLTLNVSITFNTLFIGPESVFGYATDSVGNNSGSWQLIGTWTPYPANAQGPSNQWVSPTSGIGMSQLFSFHVSDVNGYTYVPEQLFLFATSNSTLSNSCYIGYSRVTGSIFLANDANTSSIYGTLGSSTPLSNTQCSISLAQSSASGNGNDLYLNLAVSFTSPYSGSKNVYQLVYDHAAYTPGWVQVGTWTVGASVLEPDSMSPPSGTGATQTFNFTGSSPSGNAAITSYSVLFNWSLEGASACEVVFSKLSSTWYITLLNDAGTAAAGTYAVGTANIISNNQCQINVATATVAGFGNTVAFTLPVTFKSGFIGPQNVLATVSDTGGSSPWQLLGRWTGYAALHSDLPSGQSVTPNSGSGTSRAFTFHASDLNGAAYIPDELFLFYGSNTAPTAGSGAYACYVSWWRASGTVFLYSDDLSTVTYGTLGSSTPLSNSQCTINLAQSTATPSGNDLNLTLSISFAPGFGGVQYIWQSVYDHTVQTSGWSQVGTWTNPTVTISVAPTAPSLSANEVQQFTATVGNTRNTAVTWTVSGAGSVNTSGLYTAPGFISAQQAVTVTATSAADPTKSASATVSLVTTAPSITTVNPTSGAAGTQVTISGSHFGAAQGLGTVWLGTSIGTIVSWSDTQVVATVAAGSASGTARVQQSSRWSNSVAFTVTGSPTISTVSPTTGLPGTQVTITGSGFGASQGTGQVLLGTMTATVQTWSDTQVVALVATGSASGSAKVLQSGSWSNGVQFTINTPHITSISPSSGAAGTSVTISGSGFGNIQGNSAVTIGSMPGQVANWSDTQIVAAVPTGSLTGIVKVLLPAGLVSNAFKFTVPGATVASIVPAVVNMAIGDTRTLLAISSTGQTVTGLAWASSDNNVLSLSNDDPPILTALGAGHVTITAGSASADVTVFAGALPTGAPVWSNLGSGSGFSKIIPAVPSVTGVADVFGIQDDGTVAAITSDGITAWTADISDKVDCPDCAIADFQGGLIIDAYNQGLQQEYIYRLDGTTGQRGPSYMVPNGGSGTWAVHPDGTLFVQVGTVDAYGFAMSASVVGVDPTTGGQKFSVALSNINNTADMIVAGDGNMYIPDQSNSGLVVHRVSSSGAASAINIPGASGSQNSIVLPLTYDCDCSLISNGADGVLFSWTEINNQSQALIGHLTTISSSAVSDAIRPSIANESADGGGLAPMLQREDGTFVGQIFTGGFEDPFFNLTPNMVGFNANGAILWSVSNEQPLAATEDNGVVGRSGIVYDQNGASTGQGAVRDLTTFDANGNVTGTSIVSQSWRGNVYAVGSVDQIAFASVAPALSLWSWLFGNNSGNSAAARPWYLKLTWKNTCSSEPQPCGFTLYPV